MCAGVPCQVAAERAAFADAFFFGGHAPPFPAEKKLIAGDTLFQGSIGRTDLPGGNFEQIIDSLHSRLLALPDETIVVPGHGGLTTIGEERESNPFLQKR